MNIPVAQQSVRPPIPHHLLLGIFSLYVLRFGYGYGASDQDEFLPYLMHLLDASLFSNDWFVSTQVSSFSVRTYFVYLLFVPASVFSPFVAATLVYFASWYGIATGVYVLAQEIIPDRLTSILSVAIVVLMTPFWTLGGNDLVHSMLVPSMTAWAFAVWGLYFYFRSRMILAAVFAGLATLFQALVGLQVFALLVAVTGIRMVYQKKDLKSAVRLIGPYLVAASPALIPLFYQQFSSNAASTESPSLFYIMAAFRNPHHYLPHSFSVIRSIQFGVLSVLGICSYFLLRRYRHAGALTYIPAFLCSILFICMVGYAGTELVPVLSIAKLQLFKVTIVAKLFWVVLLSGIIVRMLPTRLSTLVEQSTFRYPGRFMLLMALVYPVLVWALSDRFEAKVYPFSMRSDPAYELSEWVREHTPVTAVFAIPPSWSSFRSQAQRGIVVNHKAFPYKDADIYQWFERLTTMAPVDLPPRTTPSLMTQLDAAYEQATPGDLVQHSNTYQIDYIVRSSPLPPTSQFAEVNHVPTGWYVYQVTDGQYDREMR